MIRIAWVGLCWEVRKAGQVTGSFRPLMRGPNWTERWAARRLPRRASCDELHTSSFLRASRYCLGR